ncbi:MAG: hypothetical protein LC700_03080, partial [Actinobacteria bacterium]|nr:hypothetical protein [Actinomycetota bacterium]
DVLSKHVLFEVESIDRLYLNAYVPELQRVGQVVGFLTRHLGFDIASTALVARRSEAFVAAIRGYARDHGVPLIDFVKGQRKDDIMHEHLARCDGSEQVLFIGRAQEKARVFRTERRRNPVTGAAYPWIVTATAMVNHFYVYALDDDFGPFFLKFSSYFPYTARLCINGHEYAKRQATKAGIGFTALDNGFATVNDPADVVAVQAICDGLTEDRIDALLRKWLARLPHPFTREDRAAGYRYELSILQAEFSLTQMLDKPVSGRIFFEQTIRDNLDIGRPDQVSLIFNRQVRRNTPGRFGTRVITDTVIPSLHIDYKHCQVKQYHKEGRALRTETTINDTYDFAIGKRLTNLPAPREIGFSANRRLPRVQRLSHDPADGADALAAITDPVTTPTGQRVPGMRFTDPRAQALLSTLCVFRLLPRGFTNRDLRVHLAPQLGLSPEHMTSGQITYDLRRLRLHGLIARIPHTHRYQVTDPGLRHALFLTRAHTRLLRTGLAEIHGPPTPTRLHTAARAYETAINEVARTAGLAA